MRELPSEQRVSRVSGLMSSTTDEWATPQAIFDELNEMFGPFDLDPCATIGNAKCETYFTRFDNGLAHSWEGKRVWMNPPYGRGIEKWVAKAATEPAMAVCLIPARTDTAWWHDHCMNADQILFVRGRLRFGTSTDNAPFPSAVVVFGAWVGADRPNVRTWTPTHGQVALGLEEAS